MLLRQLRLGVHGKEKLNELSGSGLDLASAGRLDVRFREDDLVLVGQRAELHQRQGPEPAPKERARPVMAMGWSCLGSIGSESATRRTNDRERRVFRPRSTAPLPIESEVSVWTSGASVLLGATARRAARGRPLRGCAAVHRKDLERPRTTRPRLACRPTARAHGSPTELLRSNARLLLGERLRGVSNPFAGSPASGRPPAAADSLGATVRRSGPSVRASSLAQCVRSEIAPPACCDGTNSSGRRGHDRFGPRLAGGERLTRLAGEASPAKARSGCCEGPSQAPSPSGHVAGPRISCCRWLASAGIGGEGAGWSERRQGRRTSALMDECLAPRAA